MSEEGKKRKAEDDRDGDSNVTKYFKSIRRGSEFAFDGLTTGWSRVPVNEYRFCLKTKRYRGNESVRKLRSS